MINYIFFGLVFFGILFGVISGNGENISKAIIESSGGTVSFIIELCGIMCFWCGVMKVAEKSGFTEKLSKVLMPVLKIIFKDAAHDKKALGCIVMNLTANMLGLANAATPFGIKAMKELQRLNNNKDTASNDMILFLILNATCVQLVPSTIISIRAACNSQNPGIIILPAIITSFVSTIVGIMCCKLMQRYF